MHPAITSPRTLWIQILVERLWSGSPDAWRRTAAFRVPLVHHGANFHPVFTEHGRASEQVPSGSRADHHRAPFDDIIGPQRMNHRSVPEVSRSCLTRLPQGPHVQHTRTRNRHDGPAPARACERPAPKHPFASTGCSDDTRCSTSHSGLAFLAMALHCGGATECR